MRFSIKQAHTVLWHFKFARNSSSVFQCRVLYSFRIEFHCQPKKQKKKEKSNISYKVPVNNFNDEIFWFKNQWKNQKKAKNPKKERIFYDVSICLKGISRKREKIRLSDKFLYQSENHFSIVRKQGIERFLLSLPKRKFICFPYGNKHISAARNTWRGLKFPGLVATTEKKAFDFVLTEIQRCSTDISWKKDEI